MRAPSKVFRHYVEKRFGFIPIVVGPGTDIWDIGIAPDEQGFIAACGTGVYLWDIHTTKVTAQLRGHSRADTYGCDISPDGTRAATVNCSGEIFVWDMASRQPTTSLTTNGGYRMCRFVLGGTSLLLCHERGIALWKIGENDITHIKSDKNGTTIYTSILGFDVSPDGVVAYVASSKAGIHAFDLRAERHLWTIEDSRCASGTHQKVAVHEKSNIGIVSYAWSLYCIDLQSGHILQSYEHYKTKDFHPSGAVAISPNGLYCATSSWNDIILWSLPTWTPIQRLTGHDTDVYTLRFAPSGNFLLSTANDGSTLLWRT